MRAALGLLAMTAPLAAGCELLPQNETEWIIAAVVTGVLVVGSAVAAWVLTKKS